MKLAPRLILSTTSAVFVAAGIGGALLIQLERSQLIADVQTETRVLTRSVQVAVENALRDRQSPDVTEMLERLELVAGQVDVMVYVGGRDAAQHASAGSRPGADPIQEVLSASRRHGEVLRMFDATEGHPHRLVLGVPLLRDSGEREGTLVVSRPLTALDEDLRTTTLLLAWSIVAFASATVLVMVFVLRRHVTQPLGEIARATETLGQDLQSPLALPTDRQDELGMVSRAMVALQRRLRAARDAQRAEVARRENLERRLRDADKLVAVGQLAAGVAHEIGSPLQVLVGRAHLIGQKPGQDEEVRRQAALIAEHAERIARIVDRLQDVIRRRPPRIEPTDLVEPVRQVMWLLESEAHRRKVDLRWEVPGRPVVVAADADEIQQAVLNLTLNALQACSPGGVVRVRVLPEPDGGVLEVTDNGRGIAPDEMARIFEPFYTRRSAEGGTGLGLAVVRSIVDRHRAKLEHHSDQGVGTTFTLHWRREHP